MKKRVEKLLEGSLAVLGYAAPVGVAVWRVLRHKRAFRPSKPKAAKRSTPKVQDDEPKLESLSLSTSGDAPLDRLARTAARERLGEAQPAHCDLKMAAPPGSKDPRAPENKTVEGLLDRQSLGSYRLEGWNLPEPERLPVPTYAPAIMAFGIVVFAMGVATIWYVCVIGSLVFAVAAWRWVGELQGE